MKLSEFCSLLGSLSNKSSLEAYRASFKDGLMTSDSVGAISVIVIKQGIVEECYAYPDTAEGLFEAKECFKEMMVSFLSNFDEYSEQDIKDSITSGIERFGDGSIQLNLESMIYQG